MRPFNLFEQRATYTHDGLFTFTDAIPGRVPFTSLPAATSERIWYYAKTDTGAQWELGIATWNGSTAINRVNTVSSSSGGSSINFSAGVTVSLVSPAQSQVVVDNLSNDLPRAEGANALAIGTGAQAWGLHSIAIGRLASAGASEASRNNSIAIGYFANANHVGAAAIGSTQTIFNHGLHHHSSVLWSGTAYTSGPATTEARFDGSYLNLPVYLTFAFEAIVSGTREGTEGSYGAIIRGVIRRGASGNASFVATPTVTEIAKTAGVTVSATAEAFTGGDFAITVTGAESQDWYWSVSIHGTYAG